MDRTGVTSSHLQVLRDVLSMTRPERWGASATECTYQVLESLGRLLGADAASFQAQHAGSGPGGGPLMRHAQSVEQGERQLLDGRTLATLRPHPALEVMARHWWELPCSLPDRTGRGGVSSLRTYFSQREWATHPVNLECLQLADEMLLAQVCGAGRSMRVLLERQHGRPFGPRELTLAELLLPHLPQLLAAAVAEHDDGVRDAPAHPPLTERQGAILRLVALGLPNRRIGHSLGISEATVRKHLENAYARLGVQSRTEAVHLLHEEETTAHG
ncbi:helix-turn-helix transcriptional regulator [Ornithinimicrobium cerasi]|uniref:Regulatory protein, luxR family n=1 Tax=Ornithinimicrobium cerasi TaxID=2248773 RepID=A0A285VGU3_9MICO|nr:LuxR C-terminal-related transcriptional regulator [Ornithinimicrobium cerasi]SOC51751.1 regulatory protein, luxR family [Ornithinimicrobium cerasi]